MAFLGQSRGTSNAGLMSKGCSSNFPDASSLEAAIKASTTRERSGFHWRNIEYDQLQIIMAFRPQPTMDHALKAEGNDPSSAELSDRALLTYENLLKMARIRLFYFVLLEMATLVIIPEIVHIGLGPGHDNTKRVSRHPLHRSLIRNESVIVDSRLDRATIEVGLEVKERHSLAMSLSYTRLCEVGTPDDEKLIADYRIGHVKTRAQGEHGIAATCRELHGGLYPRTDLVVADDPIAEIAALTWIDVYAKLDCRRFTDSGPLGLAQIVGQGSGSLEGREEASRSLLPNSVTLRLDPLE